jgi:hypothetical protein
VASSTAPQRSSWGRSHCILFNATFDPVEKQWQALQNFEMLAAQKFVFNV